MKLGGQRTPARKGGDGIERGHQLREHRLGREPGRDGMENGCELLINVVMIDKPKVLIGLSQQARGKDSTLLTRATQPVIPSAERQLLPHPVKWTELGKPVFLPYGKVSRKTN